MWLFGEGSGGRHCSTESLSSFLDSALHNGEKRRVEAHLSGCADCAQRVIELRAVVGMLRTLPPVPAPRAFRVLAPASVPAPFLATEPAAAWWRPAPLAGFRALAAAAALALAVVFAGDLTGAIGTAEAPTMVGLADESPLITAGNPPGPEPSQVLGQPPAVAGGGSAVQVPVAPDAAPVQPAPVVADGWAPHLELWALELALLALALGAAALAVVAHRRTASR